MLSFEKQQMLPKFERCIEKAFTQGKPQTLIVSQNHVYSNTWTLHTKVPITIILQN